MPFVCKVKRQTATSLKIILKVIEAVSTDTRYDMQSGN